MGEAGGHGISLTIGTAGHVDHGKTTLVRYMTGTDTDRLEEEHRRGISIVPGYAELDLPGGRRASLVDVPGHERFVKNMVSGSSRASSRSRRPTRWTKRPWSWPRWKSRNCWSPGVWRFRLFMSAGRPAM